MSEKTIDEKNLENISGAGGNVTLQKNEGVDDNDLIINPVEPDPPGGGGADGPETEGGGGGDQDLQI